MIVSLWLECPVRHLGYFNTFVMGFVERTIKPKTFYIVVEICVAGAEKGIVWV